MQTRKKESSKASIARKVKGVLDSLLGDIRGKGRRSSSLRPLIQRATSINKYESENLCDDFDREFTNLMKVIKNRGLIDLENQRGLSYDSENESSQADNTSNALVGADGRAFRWKERNFSKLRKFHQNYPSKEEKVRV